MRIRFAGFTFDPTTRAVGSATLTPKAATLLEALIDAAPEPVAREALYERLWHGTYVESGNLHNLVSEVRAALGDVDHAIIKTVPRFGYALTATVDREASRYLVRLGGQDVPLKDGANVIGRDGDVVIDSPDVSRRHARIAIDGGATIEDLGSKNGTVVNGEAIAKRELHDGDEIVLGRVRLTFHAARADVSTETFIESRGSSPRRG